MIDRRRNILLNELVDDVNSLTIAGRVNTTDRLTVDGEFGGPFSVPNGVTYDAGGGRRDDRVTFIGDPAGGVVALVGNDLMANGVTFLLQDVERLHVYDCHGDDTISMSGSPDFERLEFHDAVGDDTYGVNIGGGTVKIRDRDGNDMYQLASTGGKIRLTD